MTSTNLQFRPEEVRIARARHLRKLLEPWSFRKLAVRLHMAPNSVAARLEGRTDLSMPDIELIAPLLRMTPVELFIELSNVEPTDDELQSTTIRYPFEPNVLAFPSVAPWTSESAYESSSGHPNMRRLGHSPAAVIPFRRVAQH